MRKLYYLGAMAGLILTSCANDDLVNDPGTNPVPNDGAIAFNMRLNNQTRANKNLNEVGITQFGVWAFKERTETGVDVWKDALNLDVVDAMHPWVVMNNYKVEYDEVQERYGSHWNYDGVVGKGPNAQNLKYWDGSFTNTYFFAYGPYDSTQALYNNNGTSNPTITWNGITTTTDENKAFIYADVTKCTNADYVTTDGGYSTVNPKTVPLTFHRGMSQVRIAFHENIPGYTVTMAELKFYGETDADEAHGVVAIPADFDDTKAVGDDDRWKPGSYVKEGNAVVTYSGTNFGTTSLSYTGAVRSGSDDNLEFTMPTNAPIGTSHDTKTFSETVYNVIPNSTLDDVSVKDADGDDVEPNSGLQFVMNYTLKSEDTAETIEVKGARVYVTPKYTAWKANTVYTYVFLITRNSSGTTTGTDPDPDPKDPDPALYPIIFDEVVVTDLGTNDDSEWIINGLQLNAQEITLKVGQTFQLNSSLNGSTCLTTSWGSNDPTIASVSEDGVITAENVGTTVINALVQDSGNNHTAGCVVHVIAAD